jgi:hypothetical protein
VTRPGADVPDVARAPMESGGKGVRY